MPPIPTFAAGETPSAAKLNQLGTALSFWENPPTCYCNLAADTSWGNAAFSVINLTEVTDTDSMHDAVVNPSRILIKTAGRYEVNAGLTFAGNATGIRIAQISLTGTVVFSQPQPSTQATFGQGVQAYWSGVCVVNDYISLLAYQNSGGSLNLLGSSLYTFVQVRWVGIS